MNSRFVGLGCVGIPTGGMRIPIHKLTNEACIWLRGGGLGGSELRGPPSLLMLIKGVCMTTGQRVQGTARSAVSVHTVV